MQMVFYPSAHKSFDTRDDWWIRLPYLLGLSGATDSQRKLLFDMHCVTGKCT